MNTSSIYLRTIASSYITSTKKVAEYAHAYAYIYIIMHMYAHRVTAYLRCHSVAI